MFSTVVGNAIGVAIGGIITWLVARRYYVKAGRELRDATNELVRLIVLVLRSLEHAGLAKLNCDSTGRITGLVIEFEGKAEISLSALGILAEGEVTRPSTDPNADPGSVTR